MNDIVLCTCGHLAKLHVAMAPSRRGWREVQGKRRYTGGCKHHQGIPGMQCRCDKFKEKR